MESEKIIKGQSGYSNLLITLFFLLGAVLLLSGKNLLGLLLIALFLFHLIGYVIVAPNKAVVLVLFGEYKGTIVKNGFRWVNPLFSKNKLSLRARNFENKPIKVNDKLGNPIMISVVVVWRVKDTYKASFEVNDFEEFVTIQSETAVRKLASAYPYDTFDDHEQQISLRSGLEAINEELDREMQDRLNIAGIDVMEARINHLAYASEIAGAMLQRQQATAIVAARLKIVEGAVGMVELALAELSAKNIIELDDEKRASMVSNLMVVLCGDKNAQPVLNTGTLYS